IGFYLGDVMTHGSAGGSLLSVFVKQMVRMKEIDTHRYRLVPPDEGLVGGNRELIGLGLEGPPLGALLGGVVGGRGGGGAVGRGGGRPPVRVPATGEPEVWTAPGPFLGTADTSYQSIAGELGPGDKLLVGSDGTRPEGGPGAVGPDLMAEAAGRHRGHSGQAFVDAVARDLLPHVRHSDDFTLLSVEMTS